jgi:hypothetical protein
MANFRFLLTAAACLTIATQAQATVGYADVVLDYYNSGAGPFPGPYGGTFGPGISNFPVPVSTSVVLGADGPNPDFLSLPTGSYVTVGFLDETVFDTAGNDIFIQEVGASGERASVYVSSDNVNFTFLGIAQDDVTTAFDLASIGYASQVKSVKIAGLDAFGGSPGFDVANVQAVAFVRSGVPEPATWAMMVSGFGVAGVALRRRPRRQTTTA